MKKISLLLFLITLFVVGCKKDEIDVREQYIGKYQLQSIAVARQNNQTQTVNTRSVIEVKKGTESDKLIFVDGSDSYTVELTGTSFKIPKYIAKGNVGGIDMAFDVIGNGSFNGSNINFTQTYTGNGYLITVNHTGAK